LVYGLGNKVSGRNDKACVASSKNDDGDWMAAYASRASIPMERVALAPDYAAACRDGYRRRVK